MFLCLSAAFACTPSDSNDTAAASTTDPTGTASDDPTTGDGAETDPTTGDGAGTDPATGDGGGTGITTGDGAGTGTTTGTTGDATTGTEDTGTGTTGTPVALDCSDHQGGLRISAPELGINIDDPTPTPEVTDGLINGFRGVADGQQYWFGRDGDAADGGLAIGTHDLATYPYHLVLLVGPPDIDCEFEPGCQIFYGLEGAWKIVGEQPFVGEVMATTLVSEEECWNDGPPLDIGPCRIVPGTIEACFAVPWA